MARTLYEALLNMRPSSSTPEDVEEIDVLTGLPKPPNPQDNITNSTMESSLVSTLPDRRVVPAELKSRPNVSNDPEKSKRVKRILEQLRSNVPQQ